MKLCEYVFNDKEEYAIGFNKGSSFVFCGYGRLLNDKVGHALINNYIKNKIHSKKEKLKEQIDNFDDTYKVYTSRTLSMKKRISTKVTLKTQDEYMNNLLEQYCKAGKIKYTDLDNCEIEDIYYSDAYNRTIILLKSDYPINGAFWTVDDCYKKLLKEV